MSAFGSDHIRVYHHEPMGAIENIPGEILEDILETLLPHDIPAVAASCRKMKALVDNSFILQAILEFTLCGYCLSPDWRSRTAENSLQDVLAKFRSMITQWERFECTRRVRIETTRMNSQVVDGVLVNIMNNGTLQFYHLNRRSLKLAPSSFLKDITPWLEHSLWLDQRILCWDIEQDLMIIHDDEYYDTYIRTLTGNQPHLLAARPVFRLGAIIYALILGELLLIYHFQNMGETNPNPEALSLTDWRRGPTHLDSQFPTIGRGFFLLTNDLILILAIGAGPDICLEIISITQKRRLTRLVLPFNPSWRVRSTWRSSAAKPIKTTETGENKQRASFGDSWYSRDLTSERIAVLNFEMSLKGSGMDSQTLYAIISTNRLLRLLRSDVSEHEAAQTGECKTLAWSEWGPKSTRWLREEGLCYTSVYGSYIHFCGHAHKFIDINHLSTKPRSHANVVFLDFNPRMIQRRERSKETGEDVPQERTKRKNKRKDGLIAQHVITEESVLDSPAFTEDIRSSLPFRVFIRRQIDDWQQCPDMESSTNPIAVFTDNKHYEVYYFDQEESEQ